jgi:tetratricopeptide (TPR) repeat protein
MMPPLSSSPSQAEVEESRVSKREIDALLKQGDETAQKGERQQAIEVWSRVFLIDINNAEAVTRIEKARQEMADQGRLVADYLKRGRESFEGGDHEGARKLFLQALESDLNEPTARLYLERIERAKGEKTQAAEAQGAVKSAVPARSEDDFSAELAAFPPITPPAPASRRAGPKLNPRVLGLIFAFLALTLVGVYFVFKGPKNRDVPPTPRVSSAASLQHARDLLGNGKIDEARSELRRIGPGDPDSEEARKLLADLGKPAAADSPGGRSAPPPRPPAGAAREVRGDSDLARLRDTAEKALAEKRYIEALKNFNLAAPAFRNDPTFTKELGLASDKVTALTPAVKLYNEGEYETAIPILWRIMQEDRDNRDARSYLLRSYYNQGISQLQNGLYPKAAQSFQEALGLDSNDAEAIRHRKFAERYQKGDLDLMGRIYVRHLNHRP